MHHRRQVAEGCHEVDHQKTEADEIAAPHATKVWQRVGKYKYKLPHTEKARLLPGLSKSDAYDKAYAGTVISECSAWAICWYWPSEIWSRRNVITS